MEDIKGISGGVSKSPLYRKYIVLTLFVVFLFALFSGGFGIFHFVYEDYSSERGDVCGDGTLYNACSNVKPYFCYQGKLIEDAYTCGCPEGFNVTNGACFSNYHTSPKIIPLSYTLRGERKLIEFVAYGGFVDYISKIPRFISYSEGENFSRADFTLNSINENEQRKFLLPLVIQIQNIAKSPEDQVRIAISIVQNIPFNPSDKSLYFGDDIINYSRYPYDVIYDYQGICGEKANLLIFLLRELGYGVSLLYYPGENHEAVGIKCPVEESLIESGYCFIETTGPSIITDNELFYSGRGLLFSTPEIYIIEEGETLGKNLYEYGDVERLIKIRNYMYKNSLIGPIKKSIYNSIRLKYGLVEDYYR